MGFLLCLQRLEKDCTLGARMEDLKELLELMPEDLQSDVKKATS